jgi:glutamate synthase (NADPH/NADH) large chain
MKGENSHRIVRDGLQILENLTHRGAVGADPLMGDGAGMLLQKPDAFFREEMAAQGVTLPAPAKIMPSAFSSCRRTMTCAPAVRGCRGSHRRRRARPCSAGAPCRSTTSAFPRRPTFRPPNLCTARCSSPAAKGTPGGDDFERRLFILRKVISNTIYGGIASGEQFYIVSLSSRTIVYKGMFLAYQLGAYFKDLTDERFTSSLALVHQRFSTNTFPSWKLAHPYRMVAHNGEINTLRGNVNWMAARQASVDSELFGNDISKLWPISYEGQSDTACFDNALEFLFMGGYPMHHAVMMLVPEAWSGNKVMDDDRKAFYEYHAAADGAVGRPGSDCLHRRPHDRRNARPQRPAPGALHRHR